MKKNKPTIKKLVSIKEYAEMCNVSFYAIVNREKAGHIEYVLGQKLNILGMPVKLIDTTKYPPKPAMRRGLKA